MARKGDTPEYINKMQQELFEVLAGAKEPGEAGPTHRRVSRLNYSRRCAEASAVQAHMKQGIPLAPGMEISYMAKGAKKWDVDQRGTAQSSMLRTIECCFRRLGERQHLFSA